MTDRRKRNLNWCVANESGGIYDGPMDYRALAVLMDIRDELQAINSKLNCYRIPRALDAITELGADARRRKRLAAKRRKAKRAKQ